MSDRQWPPTVWSHDRAAWTVEAKFAGVELKYTSAITINKQPAAQTDIGANKTEADGWVIFDMSEAA